MFPVVLLFPFPFSYETSHLSLKEFGSLLSFPLEWIQLPLKKFVKGFLLPASPLPLNMGSPTEDTYEKHHLS